jgi:hypothetical protein
LEIARAAGFSSPNIKQAPETVALVAEAVTILICVGSLLKRHSATLDLCPTR